MGLKSKKKPSCQGCGFLCLLPFLFILMKPQS
jgi:hypothetical protein